MVCSSMWAIAYLGYYNTEIQIWNKTFVSVLFVIPRYNFIVPIRMPI